MSQIQNLAPSNKLSVKKPKNIIREGRWTKEEHNIFLEEIFKIGIKNWKKLEHKIKTRNNCQIRSHFQKYLKKICSKYDLKKNLTEIFVDEENLPNIIETDMKMIEIFNSYKKNKIISKKRKMKDFFKKRLQKKKFFKIKREDEKSHFLEKDKQDNMKKIPQNLSIDPYKNNNTNITCNEDHNCDMQKCIHKNLEEISIMNKNFFSKFFNFNYDFTSTIELFQSYLNSNCVNLNFFGDVTLISKNFEI